MTPDLRFDKYADGLVPAIVQDADSDRVLMLGYMNAESFRKTVETGQVTFFSRSRLSLWTKGETSGNTLAVEEIAADCDRDCVLIRARPAGPTCHRGTESCFDSSARFFEELDEVVSSRLKSGGESSYVAKLAAQGLDRVAQKVGEEAVETVIASKNDSIEGLESEAADLVFHLAVLLATKGSSLARVSTVLARRHAERAHDPR